MSSPAELHLVADEPAQCANCGELRSGRFCSHCGEKAVDRHEYSLKHLLHHAFHDITHFDLRIFRTIRPLLVEPGRLTRDHLDGRRSRYTPPLQLFLWLNILFFLVAPKIGIFAFRFPGFETNHRILGVVAARPWIASSAAASGLTRAEYAERFNEVITHQKKGFILVMIPLFAAGATLVMRRKKMYFGEHFIFATHFYAFWLIVTVAVPLAIGGWSLLFGVGAAAVRHADLPRQVTMGETLLITLLLVGSTVYLTEAVRRTYGSRRWRAMLEGFALSLMMLGILAIYRDLLFAATILYLGR